jgi:hypothetical protein
MMLWEDAPAAKMVVSTCGVNLKRDRDCQEKGCSDVAMEVLVWIYRGQHGISSALFDC